jgi:hypothetical protein
VKKLINHALSALDVFYLTITWAFGPGCYMARLWRFRPRVSGRPEHSISQLDNYAVFT